MASNESDNARLKQGDLDALDDLLNQSLEAALKQQAATQEREPQPTLFPGPPTGLGVPPKPQAPPAKPKSLASMGISRGGVVRNASTVHRTQLDNPINNPRPSQSVKASAIDQNDLPPEFAVPGTIMTTMDADLEQRAKDRIQQASSPASPAAGISMASTLAQLLQGAVNNGGTLRLANPRFVVEITITA
jgi:hypothetical protein